jgi:hypothetical protein
MQMVLLECRKPVAQSTNPALDTKKYNLKLTVGLDNILLTDCAGFFFKD